MSSSKKSFTLKLQELSLSQMDEKITNINYQCFSSLRIYPQHKCNNGKISFTYLKTKYDFILNGWFDFLNNQWDIKLSNTENTLLIEHRSNTQDLLSVKINQMDVVQFSELIKEQYELNSELISGQITAEFAIKLGSFFTIIGSYQLENFNWESDSSEYVLAETNISGDFALMPKSGSYELINRTVIDAGEGLFKDIYLVFEKDMFAVNTVININNQFNLNHLELGFELTKANIINVEFIDNIDFSVLENLKMNIDYKIDDLSVLYHVYLKSYLSIMGISNADIAGAINGNFKITGTEIQSVNAEILDLYMEIDSKKIEVNNLHSNIDWHNKEELKESIFKWDALLLAGMPINQSQLKVLTNDEDIIFADDTQLPIFDGSLDINTLRLINVFKPERVIKFDGDVKPISLALISEKMGWPVMNGYISGNVPGMNKAGDVITFDGLLELSVFDGTMQIDGLSIERLFGIAPVIAADINFQNLNLLQITSTFDFGDITGNINGYIDGMRITNWYPDRLDAYIESAKLKGVKQLISQRAIDNISSIGGIQGALAGTFLKFFDAFRYKKIGIGCKLRNSICAMKGIETSQDNYQIVKGSGLPSINIFGYRKYIDWKILIDRLINAKY